MYFVLSLQAKTLPNGWIRNHVLRLQRLWKDEMDKEQATKRKTMVPMEAKHIHPFHNLKVSFRINNNNNFLSLIFL